MIHIENINLLFSEKAGILKCAVGFICKNMDIDIVKSSYKSILINAYCLILYAKQKMHSTLPTNYLPTYLLSRVLHYILQLIKRGIYIKKQITKYKMLNRMNKMLYIAKCLRSLLMMKSCFAS